MRPQDRTCWLSWTQWALFWNHRSMLAKPRDWESWCNLDQRSGGVMGWMGDSESQNVTSFEIRAFATVMKGSRAEIVLDQGGPQVQWQVVLIKAKTTAQTQGRRAPWGRTQRLEWSRHSPGKPGATRQAKAGQDSPPETLEGVRPYQHLDFRCLAPRTWEGSFCRFKPPSLQ